jgi:hypothetical protein
MIMLLSITNICIAGETREQGDKQLFLAHNIWKTRDYFNQKCINYKTGQILPFGSEVVNARVVSVDTFNDGFSELKISFTLKNTNKRIEIGFTKKWHPGKTIYDYYDLIFTEKSLNELTAGMDAEVLQYAGQGELIPGMSKQEVILAYGYPPEHATRSLDENIWMYWRNKIARKKVCFDGQDKTVKCTKVVRKTL